MLTDIVGSLMLAQDRVIFFCLLRWFGTVLGQTKCAKFFGQNLLFMAQAVKK